LILNSKVSLAMQWLRRLTANLTPRMPVFNPRPVHMGFVVDRVTLGQPPPPKSFGLPCRIIPSVLHVCISFIYHHLCINLLSVINSLNSANEVQTLSFLSPLTNFKFFAVYAFYLNRQYCKNNSIKKYRSLCTGANRHWHDVPLVVFVLIAHISFFPPFLFRPLLPIHCMCKALLLHCIALRDTHTHTHTHTHSVGLL